MANAAVNTCSHVVIGGYDFSADFTALTMNYGSEAVDATTFGASTRVKKGGLKTFTVAGKGYVNLGASNNDPILFANVSNTTPATVFQNGITIGSTVDVGFSFPSVQTAWNFGGAIGVLLPFSINLETASAVAHATVLDNFAAYSTGVNNGTAVQMPVFTSCESLYATWHLTNYSTGIAGGTVSALIQSASSSGFGVTTTRATFSALSVRGAQVVTPVASNALSTDQLFWRSQVTVTTATSTGANASGLIVMALQQ